MPISDVCLATLLLSNIRGLGLKTFHLLHQEFGSVPQILAASHNALVELGIRPAMAREICALAETSGRQPYPPQILLVLEWAGSDQRHLVCLEDQAYPSKLKEIYCPPPLIYVEGQLDAFGLPALALVGSRNASATGLQHAFDFAKELALAGFCINSGLALGIDAAAHRGVLQANGATCAVLGTGLDVIYPQKHRALAEQIRERGVLVSEMALGTPPKAVNFPRRNRLISGLSQGVLVIEASLKSGSLITARYALEQNREVFALPGSIDNPLARGCHALIKQGASLIETVEDLLADWQIGYRPRPGLIQPQSQQSEAVCCWTQFSATEQTLLSWVNYDCVSFDVLASQSGIDVGELMHLLLELELKGALRTVPGGYQRTKSVKSPA